LSVTAASVQDRDGALAVFGPIQPLEEAAHRLLIVDADGSYRGGLEKWVAYVSDWTLPIVGKPADQKGFVVLPKRWIVERTFGWLGKYRRLSKDYEFRPINSQAMIRWAMLNRMVRRLVPT
jgi:putative transposase